jgi:hypothetical protein
MSNFSSVSRFANTSVTDTRHGKAVRLHETVVFETHKDVVTLRHGGWKTDVTKRRINEALEAANLTGWSLWQENGEWYVQTPVAVFVWTDDVIEFREDGTGIQQYSTSEAVTA